MGQILLLPVLAAEPYIQWQAEGLSVAEPLGGLQGDPVRGRAIASSTEDGNCLACHQLPIPEESFHGTVGPDLSQIAARLSEGEIRLRVVDEKRINPMTIMPGYYRHPDTFNQVSQDFAGKTFLTAQQIEDVVAYLVTLK
ncbi:MAG: sulfur oxidation c-type cytochrome SoxX [Gammaproteobacteria bacterium]|nr:sulfur oxidation c-type cytochrome SoxX [Gammaproteobacteria bacterium]